MDRRPLRIAARATRRLATLTTAALLAASCASPAGSAGPTNPFANLGPGGTAPLLVTPSPHPGHPRGLPGLTSSVAAVSTEERHTCVLTDRGGIRCLGFNLSGEVGADPNEPVIRAPFDVPSLTSGVTAIVVGGGRSCAIVRGGAECWGSNLLGMLGTGQKDTQNEVPATLPGLASGVTSIAAGDVFGCAVAAGGVKCWDQNGEGQLGDGSTTDSNVPVDVKDLALGATAVAAGDHHACALLASGSVRCWGDNTHGQVGDGTTIERHAPVGVTGLDHDVSAIAAGGDHTCALLATGGVKCWGDNADGELGDRTTTERLLPVDVVGLATGITAVSTGRAYTCALTIAGGVQCWGANTLGQLGNDSMSGSLQPHDVSDLASGVIAIAAGDVFACAVTVAGAVECWGTDDGDQFAR